MQRDIENSTGHGYFPTMWNIRANHEQTYGQWPSRVFIHNHDSWVLWSRVSCIKKSKSTGHVFLQGQEPGLIFLHPRWTVISWMEARLRLPWMKREVCFYSHWSHPVRDDLIRLLDERLEECRAKSQFYIRSQFVRSPGWHSKMNYGWHTLSK